MKTMVFIDFQNFDINMHEYYKKNPALKEPKITYTKLAQEICEKISIKNQSLIKTFIFGYKPCDELLKLERYSNFYAWLNGMKNKPYIEVIEGIQVIRPSIKGTKIDISNPATYITEEKGTDVNIAVNMISKAFTNAYDIAVLVSGDTDYVPVIKELHRLGKIVVLATLPHQNTSKYEKLYDQHIKITDELLQRCKKEERK